MKTKSPARTLQERRALDAERKFEQWLRRATAAAKKVQHYAARVKYYRRTLAKLDAQRIKNELLGDEYEACELYPAESRLVDGANQFHLWAINGQFPFGFA